MQNENTHANVKQFVSYRLRDTVSWLRVSVTLDFYFRPTLYVLTFWKPFNQNKSFPTIKFPGEELAVR